MKNTSYLRFISLIGLCLVSVIGFSVTMADGDVTAPTIQTLSPEDDATDVAIDTNFVITFDEAVDAETGNITLYKSSDDSTIEAFDVASDISGSGTTEITINPAAGLEGDTEYYIQIDATAFDDAAGNSFAGISDTTSWSFTTTDTVTITAESTLTGGVDVALSIPITLNGPSDATSPVKLVVTNGSLEMSTTTGLTFTGPSTGDTLQFEGTVADLNAALETLTYTRSSIGSDQLEVSLISPGEVFFEGTGNLYEYITFSGNWYQARDNAETLTRYGATGYLTTITSGSENSFVADRLENAGWMGAADIATEGDWQWVTGPEAGTSFWSGDGFGSAVGGAYENWNPGEPNDSAGEDCGQFLAGGSGQWNDLPCTGVNLPGYVAEFGQPGDEVTVQATTIDIETVSEITVSSCAEWNSLPNPATRSILLTQHLNCGGNYQEIDLGSYSFNGQAYSITMSGTETRLFSSVSGGVIEDLRLEGSIDGDGGGYATPLVREASSGAIIRRVASYVDMTNVGSYGSGLVGILNNSIIRNSYVAGDVSSVDSNYVGGLAGYIINDSLIEQVYMSGSVTSSDARIGGLVGLMNGTGATATSVIQNSFVVGEVSGSPTLSGALVGLIGAEISWQDDGVLVNNFYDETRTGKTVCAIANSPNVGDEAGVCEAVNTASSPDTGYFDDNTINAPLDQWNFSPIWFKNPGYPLLYEDITPGIVEFSPADNATSVGLTGGLELTFDEIVDVETGNITLVKDSDDTVVETFDVTNDVSGSGGTIITIDPSENLESNTAYYVQIANTAFDDRFGNSYAGISDQTTWQFTTAEVANPIVSALSPADDATSVSIDTDLSLTFDKVVNATTGNILLRRASDDTTVETFDVTSAIAGSGSNQITINPTADLLYNTEYYVQIDSGAFEDTEGAFFAGIVDTSSWSFTTEQEQQEEPGEDPEPETEPEVETPIEDEISETEESISNPQVEIPQESSPEQEISPISINPVRRLANTVVESVVPAKELEVISEEIELGDPISEEDRSELSVQGVRLALVLKDRNGDPMQNVDVEIRSRVQTGVTDANGEIVFENVEPGEHTLSLAYQGHTSEQKITVTDDSMEQTLILEIQMVGGIFSPVGMIVIGFLLFIILLLILVILYNFRSRK